MNRFTQNLNEGLTNFAQKYWNSKTFLQFFFERIDISYDIGYYITSNETFYLTTSLGMPKSNRRYIK